MADAKISQLPVATTPLAGTELVPVVQGGVTDQTTVEAILTGTVPSGTANGVLYLNASKVVTSGSALTFDGNTFTVGGTAQTGYRLQSYVASGNDGISILNGSNGAGDYAALSFVQGGNQKAVFYTNQENLFSIVQFGAHIFGASGSEQMRLTSTGLGIGTSSPTEKLTVSGAAAFSRIGFNANAIDTSGTAQSFVRFQSAGGDFYVGTEGAVGGVFFPSSTAYAAVLYNSSATPMQFYTSGALRATLDSSGNLGIGTSSPSARLQTNATINTTYSATNTLAGGVITYIKNTSTTNSTDATIRLEATGSASIAASSISAVHTGDGASALTFGTRTNGAADVTERLRLDSSGNLGLGVTPSAWADDTAMQINWGSVSSGYEFGVSVNQGAYRTASNTWRYQVSGTATSRYNQEGGRHQWFTAPSGTAGDAISFTQAMTLDASGNLGVGTTSPTARFDCYSPSDVYMCLRTSSAEMTFNTGAGFTGSTATSIWNKSAIAMVFGTNNTERARIPAAGGMVVGTAALATTATDGFLYVPTCAGTPTGTPTTQTGTAPIVVDTTNNKLYFYSGGQWRDAGP